MARRKLQYAILHALAPPLIAGGLRLLRASLRVTYHNADRLLALNAKGNSLIFAVWHADMLMATMAYRDMHRRGMRRSAALASLSRDGELLARTVRWIGADAVRGSSSRGGRSGLRAMERYLTEGGNMCVAVDGPRGPRHEVKLGVALLARDARASILPITFRYSRAWRLRSWDRGAIPKPFARCGIIFHDPIAVVPGADRDAMEQARAQVENILLVGLDPDAENR